MNSNALVITPPIMDYPYGVAERFDNVKKYWEYVHQTMLGIFEIVVLEDSFKTITQHYFDIINIIISYNISGGLTSTNKYDPLEEDNITEYAYLYNSIEEKFRGLIKPTIKEILQIKLNSPITEFTYQAAEQFLKCIDPEYIISVIGN